MLDMQILELEPLRVAAVRHVGPYPELGPAFQKVCEWAGRNQLFGPTTRVLGIFHDDPKSTPPAELRSDACVTVADSVEAEADAGIAIAEVPGGRYAVGTLKGPYEKLQGAYEWFMGTWFPQSGETPKDGPCFEVYLNDATSTPPEELLTAIHVPLAG
jgi:AraC family transcriptional regulator